MSDSFFDQAPLSMGFSRKKYWSGLPFPSPQDLPNPGIKSASPALAGGFFTTEPPGKPNIICHFTSKPRGPLFTMNIIIHLCPTAHVYLQMPTESQIHSCSFCHWHVPLTLRRIFFTCLIKSFLSSSLVLIPSDPGHPLQWELCEYPHHTGVLHTVNSTSLIQIPGNTFHLPILLCPSGANLRPWFYTQMQQVWDLDCEASFLGK